MHAIADHIWIVGVLLVLAVLGQTAWVTWDLMRRAAHAAAQRRQALQILDLRLAAAKFQHDLEERRSLQWAGWRKFEVERKVVENPDGDVCSFYLSPHDRKPIPSFAPGQFITLQLKVPDRPKPTVRCYSLSDSYRSGSYRISIKRVAAPAGAGCPPGAASNYLHDSVGQGDILDLKAPSGAFVLDPAGDSPVVLIGGGIGVTPVLCMLNALLASGAGREAWFFYGVRHSGEQVMKKDLEAIARDHPWLRLRVCYSQPAAQDVEGRDFHHRGRVSVDLLRQELPSNRYDFFVCGPSAMMDSIVGDLRQWGVPDQSIHFERFGPGAPKKVEPKAAALSTATGLDVTFSRSGKKVSWTPAMGTLLDLARAHDIPIESGCERGDCGTCQVAIRDGSVDYPERPSFEYETGTCLVCCSVPKTSLELEA